MIRNRTGKFLFDAEMPAAETGASIGVRTDRFTVLNVSRFEVAGDSEPASYRYNDADALLGGGVGDVNFTIENGRRRGDRRVKWNAVCSRFTLCGLMGPGLAKARVRVDGRDAGEADFCRDSPREGVVFTSGALPRGPHGIEVIPQGGQIVVPDLIAEA